MMSAPLDLYPRIEPYAQGMLAVSDGYQLYWEQSGNPDGVPVLFIHGGPGAGTNPAHRRYFCPDHYRIVLFDQRGAGRSTPYAGTEGNTTHNLVADIERLREELGIDKWFLFGGSWGSTLALVYAIKHSDRVLGMVLRGIFLGRRDEIDWFLYGMGRVFPEAWREFSEFLPEAERGDLLTHYHRRLMDPDPAVHDAAAARWSRYESRCSTLHHSAAAGGGMGDGALPLARLEAHYFVNDIFIDDDYILSNLGVISHLPAVIVQGRYDMVCPIVSADRLHRAWPSAKYSIVPDAGHSAMEPGIRAELVRAMRDFRHL